MTHLRAHFFGLFQVKATPNKAPTPRPRRPVSRPEKEGSGTTARRPRLVPAVGSRSQGDPPLVRAGRYCIVPKPNIAGPQGRLRLRWSGKILPRLPRSRNCSQRQLSDCRPFPSSGSQSPWEPTFFKKRALSPARACSGPGCKAWAGLAGPSSGIRAVVGLLASSGSCRVGLMELGRRAAEAPAAPLEAHDGLGQLGHGGRHVMAG
jgi:hypothetical protein